MLARTVCACCLAFLVGPARAQPPIPEVEVACNDTSCTALVFDNAPQVRICVPPTVLVARKKGQPPAPRLEDNDGRKLPLKRVGKRWCGVVNSSTRGVLIEGPTRRNFEVIAITPPESAAAFLNERLWTKVTGVEWDLEAVSESHPSLNAIEVEPIEPDVDFDGIADKQDVDVPDFSFGDEPSSRTDKSVGAQRIPKEPVPPTAVRANDATTIPEALPDDRSYVDVVGVGDLTGFHCTGILIRQNAVLTAAHCAPATRVGIGNDVTRFLRTVAVTEVVVHPTLDVAVLHLASKIPVVIRAWRGKADTKAPRGVARLVGFGVDAPRKLAGFGIKRRVDVPVEGWGCDRGRAKSAGCSDAAELVIAGVGGRDTCWGDSGGPVLEANDMTYRILGITSRPASNGGAPCGRGGIYVRMDAISDWLRTTVEKPRD